MQRTDHHKSRVAPDQGLAGICRQTDSDQVLGTSIRGFRWLTVEVLFLPSQPVVTSTVSCLRVTKALGARAPFFLLFITASIASFRSCDVLALLSSC